MILAEQGYSMIKRLISVFLIWVFLISFVSPGYGYSQIPEFLCEVGIKFYQRGRFEEALHEFKKALIIQPNYEPALKYIQMIEQMSAKKEGAPEIIPYGFKPSAVTTPEAIKEYLDIIEMQKAMMKEKPAVIPETGVLLPQKIEKKVYPPKILTLDESLSKISTSLEIEQGKSIIIKGENIQRFLITQPGIVIVEKKSNDELFVTGNKVGYTYLHIWDDRGRWTIEFLCTLPKPEGPTLEESMLLEEERAAAFKLRYSLDWNSYEQGRRLGSLKRQYYSWYHELNFTGSTPYGDLDSTTMIRTLRQSTDLSYFTVGLTKGKIGPFKDFALRGFDFYPSVINLISGGMNTLRGAMLESPVFHNKIDYTAFWGREGGGRYGGLSPGLQKIKNSFLNGVNINYHPDPGTNFGVSVLHGSGRDRASNLNKYGYDTDISWHTANWGYRYEAGYNTEKLAHLFSGTYIRPRLKFSYELRDIEKDFLNIVGNVWRQGELGGLFNFNLQPQENLDIYNVLDIFRDRQFPAPDKIDRWNEDYDFTARYNIDQTSSLRLNYILQNELGRLSQYRYLSPAIGLSKSFNLIRNINSFVDYRHQERKNFTNPSGDYINENISAGLRFNLIGQLYYFLNKQWNWLTERYNGNHTRPEALETGVDLASQISDSSFYENIRFIYRDEENAESGLSFLAGEDYIEGYAELSYRPTPSAEAYCSTRVRNVWADNPTGNKHIETDFNLGMRYLWDTGIHWESEGNIEGYVFRDLNSDGLRQKDEAPVEGIKIWLGKNKSATTNMFGYYKFSSVKGKKAFVTLDAQSLPSGFVLTVPQRQEVMIAHGQPVRVDFGIISRSEISGVVFYDANDDGEYNPGDMGIKDVVLTLENGTQSITDGNGRYSFRNALTGEHVITLDLNRIPKDYLPKVSITKELTLFEGVTYVYNIPLKKIKK
jgi:hypothetical protein